MAQGVEEGLVPAELPRPQQNSSVFVCFTEIFFEQFTNQGPASLLVTVFGGKSSSSSCACILMD